MTQGYYAGITGIQAHQYSLDVITDNLANVGTTGYKASTTEFADLFSKAIENNTPTHNDIGHGVKLQATSFQMQQGALMPSDRVTDLALDGDGWFGISGREKPYFTRDGHFVFDTFQSDPTSPKSSASRLVTIGGQPVLGTMLNNFEYNPTFNYSAAKVPGEEGAYVITQPTLDAPLADVNAQGELVFPTRLSYPAEPTTITHFYGNLGIKDEIRTMSGKAISASGGINTIKLTFTKSAVQPKSGIAWDVTATVTSRDGETLYDTQTGQATFKESGLLDTFTLTNLNNDGTPVTIDLGISYGGLLSSAGIPISASSQSDGINEGYLTGYSISSEGIIIADFSNGRQSAIGRIAVYHFQNDQGLNRDGGTYFTESSDSGKPLFWRDADGNAITGAIVRSGNLEASNVRTDVGLTDMIIMQRAYQANSKIITTVDEMIQKAIAMHR